MARGACLSEGEIAALVAGRHGNPFALLGDHDIDGRRVLRALAPGAETLTATGLDLVPFAEMTRIHPAGLFEAEAAPSTLRGPVRYQATGGAAAWAFIDPYTFAPVLGPMDDYYVAEGSHLRLYDKLGAHPMRHQGFTGVHFAVWAPNAATVAVVGPFNDWDSRRHVMRKRVDTGIWEIFIPDIGPDLGQTVPYKFAVTAADGVLLPLKADPFAFAAEMRPANASVVARTDRFEWTDADWLARRASTDARRAPMSIYEVHLGSWRRHADGTFYDYDRLAAELIPYVADLGFTHVELLPVAEHPYDPSWGYQTTGLFAPTARFGTPDGFARFVDAAHRAGIGVIVDWVPAHFPTDAHGLGRFDGTALYEHEDPRQGFHPDWNTLIYNFGRREVVSFLVNNALFWLERYHVDGLRVDAVASMLYLDYSRKDGEWIPNRDGGNLNLDAIEFLKRLNATVYADHPGIMMIAEESTSYPKVSAPVDAGGLGFGFKWNMGFMHDSLAYMKRESIHRKYHHNELTFGLLYAFSENFVLPLSHDEVVHGKGTILEKMSGDDWRKFATLRAYYGLMWAYPGKKLLFMGQEFGHRREWSEARGLDWDLLAYAPHVGIRDLVRDLNRAYRDLPALHARDCESDGFQWCSADDADNSVFVFERRGGEGVRPVVVVSHFTPVPREGFTVPMPIAGRWREVINTNAGLYGGSGHGNMGSVMAVPGGPNGAPAHAVLTVPPLATLILEFDPGS
ncbi:MAG: 1,4-alpha-glucan branching protein GlgB [Hyphomicrobiaceae bacterium]|nr:1,4-alpha-glucan branching protein GlgB [Hyphomicrobiaceae bacterium]